MDKKFKWNMFMTSFIPLWLSIIVSNVWCIVDNGVRNWLHTYGVFCNILMICKRNWLSILVVLLILVMMLVSISSINRFLNDKCSSCAPPKVKIKSAIRANKLSSEFLLAYILPMIAFDYTELKSVVLFAIYFAMLAFLCIRNSNVYTNDPVQ